MPDTPAQPACRRALKLAGGASRGRTRGRLRVGVAKPVRPPRPPVVRVGVVGAGGDIGRTRAAPASQLPLLVADKPELPRHAQRVFE